MAVAVYCCAASTEQLGAAKKSEDDGQGFCAI